MKNSNYDVINDPGSVPIKHWTRGVPLEDAARAQLQNIAKLPFIHGWVAVMPDVHLGKGATVGSVVPTVGAIVPAAVGVDIGCGMMAARTTLTASDLPDDLAPLRSAIESAVPHGRTASRGQRDKGAWENPPELTVDAWTALKDDFARIVAENPSLAKTNNLKHLGTLGTGNHFVEVCLDEEQRVWFMLHSGSRGVGNAIGVHFIELAKKYISEIDAEIAARPPPKDEERPVVVVRAEPSAFTTQRKIAIGVGAAGLTSLGLAVAFGVHSGSLRDDATALCPTTSCDNADEANVLLRRADTSARNANIAAGVGAGAIVLAGVLWILGKPEHSSPAAVTTTARISPSFAGIDITMRF